MYFQYINFEWEASASVLFSMHDIVKSTLRWPKRVVDD
jgi:hypothetical protein